MENKLFDSILKEAGAPTPARRSTREKVAEFEVDYFGCKCRFNVMQYTEREGDYSVEIERDDDTALRQYIEQEAIKAYNVGFIGAGIDKLTGKKPRVGSAAQIGFPLGGYL